MTPILDVKGLVAGYGKLEILHGVDVAVDPGEIVSLLGPNGAGKSSLAKAVVGLCTVKSGQICFNGASVVGWRTETFAKLGVSYVPQVSNVFPSLTVRENLDISLPRRLRGDRRGVLDEVLEMFPELAHSMAVKAGRLSGGERQMLALSRAMVARPSLLILDEPSAALAPRVVDAVFERLGRINQEGVAILLIEQRVGRALSVSHRGYVLVDGENALSGTSAALMQDHRLEQMYFGDRESLATGQA